MKTTSFYPCFVLISLRTSLSLSHLHNVGRSRRGKKKKVLLQSDAARVVVVLLNVHTRPAACLLLFTRETPCRPLDYGD